MARPLSNSSIGLQQIFPTGDAAHSATIDVVAIHGLGTKSPRTWEYKKEGGGVVNWLADTDMLPAVIPNARIFTYSWNANYFSDAPVQTIFGHADTLLCLLAENRGSVTRPLIFIASCFGGLILAQAIRRAAEEGSTHRHIMRSTVGAIFLATPFRGSDGVAEARWQVTVGGIMGEQTSQQLVDDLDQHDKHLRELTQTFAKIARRESIQLPLYCFYETKKTEILRRFLSPRLANRVSTMLKGRTRKLLVTEDSACLDTFECSGLDATHSGMNKFNGPESANFKLVKHAIETFAQEALSVLKRREKSPKEIYWTVPFGRNRDFVGRGEILRWLLERIPPDVNRDDCQRTTMKGLGGVGKTQLALEAAFRVRDQHPDCSVFWVPVVDITSFENAYREIGRKLQVPRIDEDKADVKTLVKNALGQESCGCWLLIIDNADDMELLFGTTALCEYLPFSLKGSILFTTRNNEVVAKLDIPKRNIHTAAKMTGSEAADLLRTNLDNNQTCDHESVTALLELLTHLPLAIKQASAYMAKTGMSITKYLHYCRSSDKRLIELLGQETEYQGRYKAISNAVTTTWLISFNHISRDKPLAATLLRHMSFLIEKDIPLPLFLQDDNGFEVDEAIGILKGYAFITERADSSSVDVHRLVQLAMRNWLEKDGQQKHWIETTIQLLADAFPFPVHENRDVWRQYLPHVLTAVTFQEACTDEEANSDLLFKVAESHALLGKYAEAEQMYRQTLDQKKKFLGDGHPSTLNSMNNLAIVLEQQGKYEKAEQMHRQTLDQRKKVLGDEHPYTLSSMNNLATVLQQQGKCEEAEQMHRQTVDQIKKVLGDEHPSILSSMNNLAEVLRQQGKYDEAEQMHRQELNQTKKVLGDEHPSTLDSMNNLAIVLEKQGKYDEAEQMLRQALNQTKNVLGDEHPSTLENMNNLAVVLQQQEKYEEAEQMHRQTLDQKKKMLGDEHPSTLGSMNNLAVILQQQGKYEEAEQMHRQALNQTRKVLGDEHPSTLDSMKNLAVTLEQQGKYEEADIMDRSAKV